MQIDREPAVKQSGKRAKGDKTTRDEILAVAASLIVSEGYGGCTVRTISDKVNIKAGSIYYHFTSKDEIVSEIMNTGVEMLLNRVRQSVESLPANASFRQKLHAVILAHISCKLDKNLPFMGVYEHLPPIIKKQSRLARKKYADFWRTLFEDAKQSGEVRSDLDTSIAVPFILTSINRVPEWFRPDRMSLGEVTSHLLDMVMRGIEGTAGRSLQ